jgi:hypothetical protein
VRSLLRLAPPCALLLALGEQGVGQLSLDMDIEGTPLRVRLQNLASGAATERVTLE